MADNTPNRLRIVEPIVAALAAVVVVWMGSWGYAALESTRQVGHRAQRAVAIADALAAAAGLDLTKPDSLEARPLSSAAMHSTG
jgi:hypothetical protein